MRKACVVAAALAVAVMVAPGAFAEEADAGAGPAQVISAPDSVTPMPGGYPVPGTPLPGAAAPAGDTSTLSGAGPDVSAGPQVGPGPSVSAGPQVGPPDNAQQPADAGAVINQGESR